MCQAKKQLTCFFPEVRVTEFRGHERVLTRLLLFSIAIYNVAIVRGKMSEM